MAIWVSTIGGSQVESFKRLPVPMGCVPLHPGALATNPAADAAVRPRSDLVNWRHWLIVIAVGGAAWLLVAGLVVHLYQSARTSSVAKANPPMSIIHSGTGASVDGSTASTASVSKIERPEVAEKKPDAPPPAAAAPQPVSNTQPSLAPTEPIVKAPELPRSELTASEDMSDLKRYGTTIDLAENPEAAARLALKEKKLLFVLHLSGNFEDDKFT